MTYLKSPHEGQLWTSDGEVKVFTDGAWTPMVLNSFTTADTNEFNTVEVNGVQFTLPIDEELAVNMRGCIREAECEAAEQLYLDSAAYVDNELPTINITGMGEYVSKDDVVGWLKKQARLERE